jgi:hypothetical protein
VEGYDVRLAVESAVQALASAANEAPNHTHGRAHTYHPKSTPSSS